MPHFNWWGILGKVFVTNKTERNKTMHRLSVHFDNETETALLRYNTRTYRMELPEFSLLPQDQTGESTPYHIHIVAELLNAYRAAHGKYFHEWYEARHGKPETSNEFTDTVDKAEKRLFVQQQKQAKRIAQLLSDDLPEFLDALDTPGQWLSRLVRVSHAKQKPKTPDGVNASAI